MISPKSISSSATAANYHIEKNGQQRAEADGRAEYYQKDEVRSAWSGAAAELYRGENGQLLADQKVSKTDFINVLDGKVRDAGGTERTLGKWGKDENGEKAWLHRCGVDFTFSSCKSLSINSEVFGNKDARDAHEKGVDAGMRFLEAHAAYTRVNGELVATGNLLYARFEHSLSRELDCNTHTHCLIGNLTYVAGKWYSLSNEKLLELRATGDAISKNEAAAHLLARGYQLEFDGKGGFEYAGFTKEQRDVFSVRSAQIDDALRAQNIDPATASYEARQAACLATRAGKDAPDNAEAQREQWLERAAAAGITASQAVRELSLLPSSRNAEATLDRALNHLTERESAFSTLDLYKAVATFAEGRATLDQLEKAISQAQESGTLLLRQDGKYTTSAAIEAEQHMAERLEAGRGAHMAVMTEKEFRTALADFEARKGFALTPEQRDAARMMLTDSDRFQGVQGLAGTGKTTMLQFVREAAEARGFEVRGFSNGSEQAAKLEQESGIRSTTTARHLIDQGKADRDATLAAKAVATYDRGVAQPDFNVFRAFTADAKIGEPSPSHLVGHGHITREYDTAGRVFYSDQKGNVYAQGLYERATSLESANVNHIGLTETRYVQSADGQIFKQGGTLASEAAGALHEKFNDASRSDQTGRAAVLGDALFTRAEGWQKVTGIEAELVSTRLDARTTELRGDLLGELKTQAASRDGEPRPVLYIMDEASQSGQREYNRVVDTTEQAGARVVFLGDKTQHQGVEAGRAMERAIDHMPTAELGRESIRRQVTEHTKEAVGHILDGRHDEAYKSLAKLDGKSGVTEIRDAQEKVIAAGGDRAAIREAAHQDNRAVTGRIATDYAALSPEDRRATLVLTATNADRQAINEGVRDHLKASGELGAGKSVPMLDKTDRTDAQMGRAASYQKGDAIEFQARYKSLGVHKLDVGTVEKTDTRLNTVTVRMEDGRSVVVQPDAVANKNVFKAVDREFSVDDRVRLTQNYTNRATGDQWRNGQVGTVEKFDGKTMDIKLDNGKQLSIDVNTYRHIDHAYAATSYASQGQTVNTVWAHHNTEGGRHGDRETYVNITRARLDVKVYTQDIDKASRQAGTALNKESATLQVGDRIAMGTSNEKQVMGAIEKIADKTMSVRLDSGEKVTGNIDQITKQAMAAAKNIDATKTTISARSSDASTATKTPDAAKTTTADKTIPSDRTMPKAERQNEFTRTLTR